MKAIAKSLTSFAGSQSSAVLRLLTITCSLTSPLWAVDRPNVILIVTDDQGYGDIACHGNPWLATPNLDRLCAEGVSLEDYHVDLDGLMIQNEWGVKKLITENREKEAKEKEMNNQAESNIEDLGIDEL